MTQKVMYICDACGKEHDAPPISLWISRADASLKVQVCDGPSVVAIPEDGLLNFCDIQCLHEYFAKYILPKTDTKKEKQ